LKIRLAISRQASPGTEGDEAAMEAPGVVPAIRVAGRAAAAGEAARPLAVQFGLAPATEDAPAGASGWPAPPDAAGLPFRALWAAISVWPVGPDPASPATPAAAGRGGESRAVASAGGGEARLADAGSDEGAAPLAERLPEPAPPPLPAAEPDPVMPAAVPAPPSLPGAAASLADAQGEERRVVKGLGAPVAPAATRLQDGPPSPTAAPEPVLHPAEAPGPAGAAASRLVEALPDPAFRPVPSAHALSPAEETAAMTGTTTAESFDRAAQASSAGARAASAEDRSVGSDRLVQPGAPGGSASPQQKSAVQQRDAGARPVPQPGRRGTTPPRGRQACREEPGRRRRPSGLRPANPSSPRRTDPRPTPLPRRKPRPALAEPRQRGSKPTEALAEPRKDRRAA
jgi:hypothetical protein